MTARHRTVFHVGRLSVGAPLRLAPTWSSASYEGVALSVSLHPEEWAEIAKLGGGSVYSLRRADGKTGRFVVWSAAVEALALDWCVRCGLARSAPSYDVIYQDEDENGAPVTRTMEFTDRREALEEAAYFRSEGDASARVKMRPDVAATSAFREAWVAHFRGAAAPVRVEPWMVRVECLNRYVAARWPQMDGIWWDEDLDVANLSAPRGNILPHALPRWVAGLVRSPRRRHRGA